MTATYHYRSVHQGPTVSLSLPRVCFGAGGTGWLDSPGNGSPAELLGETREAVKGIVGEVEDKRQSRHRLKIRYFRESLSKIYFAPRAPRVAMNAFTSQEDFKTLGATTHSLSGKLLSPAAVHVSTTRNL
jgi:hypothetical protein